MDLFQPFGIMKAEASNTPKGRIDMTTFSKNLKRFRVAKNMTQEQAAERLGISTQTVSRWECDTTLPDVTILPKIAALYCVTIDDLYQESSMAYDHYAHRLLGVYEASGKPHDFLRADAEFRKLLSGSDYTMEDLRLYGILHQDMMHYCIEKTTELFDRVIQQGPGENPETYWSVKRQKGYFLWEIGRNQECIDEYLPLVQAGSNELQEWICLIQAYLFAGEHETALQWAEKAALKFPESAALHIYTGDLYRATKCYEKAFTHWKRARELEPEWLDAAWSMASCYEELEKYEDAYKAYTAIVAHLERRGFDAETNYPRTLAHRCKEKISS